MISILLLTTAFRVFPQQQKMIYRLSREEGLSRHEMADRLGITPNTVRNHLARALEMIRHELQRDVNGLLLWICMIEISVP